MENNIPTAWFTDAGLVEVLPEDREDLQSELMSVEDKQDEPDRSRVLTVWP